MCWSSSSDIGASPLEGSIGTSPWGAFPPCVEAEFTAALPGLPTATSGLLRWFVTTNPMTSPTKSPTAKIDTFCFKLRLPFRFSGRRGLLRIFEGRPAPLGVLVDRARFLVRHDLPSER